MKVYKILLKEIKEENKYGFEPQGGLKCGVVAYPFTSEGMELKEGDTVYFQDDYIKRFNLDGVEYISTNPGNIVCQK